MFTGGACSGGVSGPEVGCLVETVILFTEGGGCLVETPPGTATAAGGTHPAGMHSCFKMLSQFTPQLPFLSFSRM